MASNWGPDRDTRWIAANAIPLGVPCLSAPGSRPPIATQFFPNRSWVRRPNQILKIHKEQPQMKINPKFPERLLQDPDFKLGFTHNLEKV